MQVSHFIPDYHIKYEALIWQETPATKLKPKCMFRKTKFTSFYSLVDNFTMYRQIKMQLASMTIHILCLKTLSLRNYKLAMDLAC